MSGTGNQQIYIASTKSAKKRGQISSQRLVDDYQKHLVQMELAKRHNQILVGVYVYS